MQRVAKRRRKSWCVIRRMLIIFAARFIAFWHSRTRMTAVSCPSALECTGTGSFPDASNNDTFLAEQYS